MKLPKGCYLAPRFLRASRAVAPFIGTLVVASGLSGVAALEVSAQTVSRSLDLSARGANATAELRQVYEDRPSELSVRVALSDEEIADLAIFAYQPFSADRRVFLDGEILDPATYGGRQRYYRGSVVGESGSYALVGIDPDGDISLHVALEGSEYQGQSAGGVTSILRAASSPQPNINDWPATDIVEPPDLPTPAGGGDREVQVTAEKSSGEARSASIPVATGLYSAGTFTVPAGQDYVGVVNRGPGIAYTYIVPTGQNPFDASYCEGSKCFIANPAAGDYDVWVYKFDSSNNGLDLPTTINWDYGTSLANDELYALTLAFDLDDALYAQFGSSASNVNTYLAQLVSYVSTTYEEELSTRLLIGDVFLYTSDPYVDTTSTLQRLQDMADYWRANYASVDRGLAVHLGPLDTFGGGIAYRDTMCDSSLGYSVSGVSGVAPTNPSQINWDAFVVAHELGHNVVSEHTHCYDELEGNSNPVDACWNKEDSCWAGSESLPGVGALTGGSAGNQNGTIMSYCHQRTGGYDNLARTFGTNHAYGIQPERVPTRMSRRISQTGAASGECLAVLTGTPPGGTIPGIPVITRFDVGDGEIYLYVDADDDGGSPILEYWVTCEAGGVSDDFYFPEPPIQITGLTNGTAYQCSVRVRNNQGWSDPSPTTEPLVPEETGQVGLPVWMLYKAVAGNNDGSVDGGGAYCSSPAETNVDCVAGRNLDTWWEGGSQQVFTIQPETILSVPFTTRSSASDAVELLHATNEPILSGYGWELWISTEPGGNEIHESCRGSYSEARTWLFTVQQSEYVGPYCNLGTEAGTFYVNYRVYDEINGYWGQSYTFYTQRQPN